VPEIDRDLNRVPADLPPTVIAGLQNWHNLPEYIRRALETLLDTAEKHRTADLRITKANADENASD